MPIINPSLPADGDDAIVAPYNTAITAMLAVINGFIDSGNLADDAVATDKLADLSVTVGKLAGGITPSKLATGAVNSEVVTAETTASTSFANLTTVQSVVVTIGTNGLLLVGYSTQITNSGGGVSSAAPALSGANTYAANIDDGVINVGTSLMSVGRTKLFTGLTAGSTTVTLKFYVSSGTGTFSRRALWALPL